MTKTCLSIVGSTATGKTDLALQLSMQLIAAQKYLGVDIISADSRQVYQGLEITSGADIPLGFSKVSHQAFLYPFFQNGQLAIHGQSMLTPDAEWSVVHFQHFAQEIVQAAWQHGRLPIIVGGTALYQLHLFNPELALQPGPNEALRSELLQLTTAELQAMAEELDPDFFAGMNVSDRANPRRLVRVIEKAKNANENSTDLPILINKSSILIDQPDRHLFLGLKIEPSELASRIRARVEQRWKGGALAEAQAFQDQYGGLKLVSASTTGLQEMSRFLDKELRAEEAKSLWVQREGKYAKEQMQWWKRESQVAWFEVGDDELLSASYQMLTQT